MTGTGKKPTSWRRQMILWRRRVRSHCLLQVLLIAAFWQAGEAIVHFAHLPIPGAVVGMFLVLLLLLNHWFSLQSLRRGAKWFLAELLLFMLPSVLSLLDHPELLGPLGLKIFAAILLGTVIVMTVTALVIEMCHRWLTTWKGGTHA